MDHADRANLRPRALAVHVVGLAHWVADGGWGRVGMRREPGLTFEGALRILGQHEHKTIERIDKLLGGVILGSGAVALGVTPLAPIAAFGVVWGWIEQKGLAVDLLNSAIDAVSERVSGLRGYERLACRGGASRTASGSFGVAEDRTRSRNASGRGRGRSNGLSVGGFSVLRSGRLAGFTSTSDSRA